LSNENPKALRAPAWPVYLSLGSVALLIALMIGLDVFFAMLEARKTTEIVQGSRRSIILLDDLRVRARRLTKLPQADQLEALASAIAADGRDYDPIATFEGEREQWSHLRGLLGSLVEGARTHSEGVSGLDEEVDRSIASLVSIHAMAGSSNVEAIREAHGQAIWSDVIAGAGVLGIVIGISAWLLRVLTRQRRLITERVQFLDEKNRELEAFAGRAAHDLRSPMNPIRGYTDLILESPSLPADLAEMARKIRRAVDRMARVVDDMLALSISGRPTTGQCSTNLVVTRVIEEMGPELHGIEVVTRLTGGRAACSEGVLNQLLRNLIGNAIKFRSRSRPLRLTIETRDAGTMVEIAVEDNGVGMDPESARHALEPFYRGQTELELPGHGLGLAIVDRTTHALGGSCHLSSVLDRGTQILMRIPPA
jgi:signal transduction histidine kinase